MFEIVRKLLLIFFKNLSEICKHKNFTLSLHQTALFLNECAGFDILINTLIAKLSKRYGCNRETLEWCIGLRNIRGFMDQICDTLLERLLEDVRSLLIEPISNSKFENIDLATIIESSSNRQANAYKLEAHFAGRLET